MRVLTAEQYEVLSRANGNDTGTMASPEEARVLDVLHQDGLVVPLPSADDPWVRIPSRSPSGDRALRIHEAFLGIRSGT